MRSYVIFKGLPASEPENSDGETDVVVTSARESHEEQVRRAKTPQDRQRAERTLVLFLKKHGLKAALGAIIPVSPL